MKVVGVVSVVAALTLAAGAAATAPPVTSLPRGPSSAISTTPGERVAVALPHRKGLSWRIARTVDARVLREVDEGDVGAHVVVVFKAVRRGRATVVFALTRGETAKAYASRTYVVTVR
jgi:hypothetical protein